MSDQRFIQYGGKKFPLEPGMTLEQAKDIMARHFPELADPKVDTKKDGDTTIYVFSKKAGHKGTGSIQQVVQQLGALKPATFVQPAIVRICASNEVPAGDERFNTNQVENLANDLGERAAVVGNIATTLRDLPSIAIPTGSVL